MDRVIIIFRNLHTGTEEDLDIPLDITANDLVKALNIGLNLGINTDKVQNCYLKAENPIVLLRGNRTLADFGIRNGSIINFMPMWETI